MNKKKLDLSSANVDSITDKICNEFEPEEWLGATASQVGDMFEKLRYSLKKYKNAPFFDNHQILAFFYYNLGNLFYKLFIKYRVDSQSIVQWMSKCLFVLKEIPDQPDDKLSKLSKSAECAVNKIQKIRSDIRNSSDKAILSLGDVPENVDRDSLGKAILALGDVPEDVDISEYLYCGVEEKKRIQRTLKNITLLRVISFLEDVFSNSSSEIEASICSRSLSKAYSAAGLRNFEIKFTNTTSHLMRIWCFKENDTDKRKEMTNLIMQLVKDKKDVHQVVDVINEHFHIEELTDIDRDYIEREYSKFCLQEFIEESVITVKKMKGTENKQRIVDLLSELKQCCSLFAVPHPINELEYFSLTKYNSEVITPKDADEALRKLKLKCFESILDCFEMIKKELEFLELFMELLDWNMHELEEVVDLRNLCSSESAFGDFLSILLKLEHKSDPRFTAVQEAAKVLRRENNLFYVEEFKKIICDYLRPPEFQLKKQDGRSVVEVKSQRIVMSDILKQNKFNELLSNPSCEEVHFISGSIIHVDTDFEQPKWHGKNILVITDAVVIHDERIWNVSGNDVTSSFDSPAETHQSGVGINGKDGDAGESGGDVQIWADSILNPENLTVISNGGAGGKGQSGGNGRDGAHGKSADKKTFLSTFPPAACYKTNSSLENVLTTIKSIKSKNSSIEEKYYCLRWGQRFTDRRLDDIISDLEKSQLGCEIYIEACTQEGQKITFSFQNHSWFHWYRSAYLLFKGSDGKPGFAGGKKGMGGQGGLPGEISVRSTRGFRSPFKITTEVFHGAEGSSGNDGKYGNHGKNGSDIGYLDYMISNWFIHDTWPKQFGGDTTITLKYHATKRRDLGWCPYRKEYVSMEENSPSTQPSLFQYQKTTNASNASRKSNSIARRKKAISHSSVLVNYQQHINSMGKAFLSNLYDETNEAIDQAQLAVEDNQTNQQETTINARIMKSATFERRQNRIQNLEEEGNSWIDNGANNEDVSNGKWKTKRARDHLSEFRFVCLFEIARELESRELQNDSPMNSIDLVATMRYLVTDKRSNDISHRTLGYLDDYVFGIDDELFKALTDVFKGELEYNQHLLLDIFKTFIFEAGNLKESSVPSNNWYKKYMLLADRKNRGFLVFSESVKKLDKEFISSIFLKNGKDECVMNDCIQFIEKKGSESVTCLELLAYVFNVNIRVYTPIKNQKFGYVLKMDLHSNCQQSYHLLIDCNRRTLLYVDDGYQKLETRRETLGILFSKIIEEFELLPKAGSLKTTVDGILRHFSKKEDTIILEPRLYKLSPKYLGRTDILEIIFERFKREGNKITAQELVRVINSVLSSVAEGNKNMNTYRWICTAIPQHYWMSEILLMDLETFFRRSLKEKTKWREYLRKISNNEILVMIRDKIRKLDPVKDHSTWCLNEIFRLLSEIQTDRLRMGHLDLAVWPHALKEKYWKRWLSSLSGITDDELSTCVYYALSIENICGSEVMDEFIQLLTKKIMIKPKKISGIFSNINDGRWTLGTVELKFLKKCKSLDDWERTVENHYLSKESKPESLVSFVKENANTSESVKTILTKVQRQMNTIINIKRPKLEQAPKTKTKNILNFREKKKIIKPLSGSRLHGITDKETTITKQSSEKDLESNIKKWVKDKLASCSTSEERRDFLDTDEALDMINRGIELKKGFRLHDTQILTVVILLENKRSTLAQVATGEGKSLIVVAASIIKALKGEKVDVITSSSVLAKRDAEANVDIYTLFGINVSHNCDEDVELRKAAYSGNQVVYGDLSDFQRDYLLHNFYNINILGDRNFECIFIDEVDSMLLDKGNNMLYLSQDIPWFDKLESVYLYIWQWINRPCFNKDGVLSTFDAAAIKESVLCDLFGRIGKEEIKSLETTLSNLQVDSIWESLFQHEIIDSKSRPTSDKVDRFQIEKALTPDFKNYTDRLVYLLTECIMRDRHIQVPNCLKKFVELHLDMWIANAISAYFMKEGEDYVVDVDRTGTSVDRNPNITIIDKDTGTDQYNTQWVEALHQFLQLKHNCKLSSQNLKAVFISNVSYFKLYNKLYGLTGTLGMNAERELLKEVHEVDFVTIPTANRKQFNELIPSVFSEEGAWLECIQKRCKHFVLTEKRSVLIVCNSVNDAKVLYQTLSKKTTLKIHKYTREYEEFGVIHNLRLSPGHIIIATNLAGRGTNIKIDQELEENGGLHVILSYLPNNARIEQQAFGRAARCGDKGSGELIFISHEKDPGTSSFIIHLKNQRDLKELERLSQIKLYYENQISAEENYFRQFKEQYFNLIENIKKHVDDKEVQDILLRSCIDKWALWLDENGGLITDLPDSKSFETLDKSLNKFLSELTFLKYESEDWISWVERFPVAKVKLAKHFFRQKKLELAIQLFDSVIETEPNFSASAHYYKAGALGEQINWASEEDLDKKSVFENELLQAAKLFEKLEYETANNAAIVSKMKCSTGRGILQIKGYEEQSKNIANIYKFFSNSISVILGHAVGYENFLNNEIKDTLAFDLQQRFLDDGTLIHSTVSRDKMSQSEIEVLCSGYGISVSDLDNFLKKWDHRTIFNYRDFMVDMKHNLCLPSREKFWIELLQMTFLTDEVKYLIVNVEKLGAIDPSLLDSLEETCRSKHELVNENGYLLLNELPQENSGIVLLKDELVNKIGKKRYSFLKSRGVFEFNKKCRLDETKINSVQSGHQYFKYYDSISVNDFVRHKVNEKDAEKVLHELVDQGILKRGPIDKYRLAVNFFKISNISLTYSLYEPMTKSLLHACFAYRIAFQKITSQDNGGYTLKIMKKPYFNLFWDLYNSKVICPIKLSKGRHTIDSVRRSLTSAFDEANFPKLLDGCVPREDSEDLIEKIISMNWLKTMKSKMDETHEKKFDDIMKLCPKYGTYEKAIKNKLNGLLELSTETAIEHIAVCLDRLKSKLDILDAPKFCLKPLKEADGMDVSYAQEMYSFISNDLGEILILEEKKYSLRMIISTCALICMSICQIALGFVIDVCSFGTAAMLGAFFQSNGYSDIMFAFGALRSGYFSWADYAINKLISLVSSASLAGFLFLGYLGKAAKSFVSRVGSKLSSYLLGEAEAVGEKVVRTTVSSTASSIGTEFIKQLSLKAVQGVSFGAMNLTIDTVVDNALKRLYSDMAKEIMEKFECEWKSHRITSVLRKAYEVMGASDARKFTSTTTTTLLKKPSEWDKWRTLAGTIFVCISEYIKNEMANRENAEPLALSIPPILQWVHQRLSCTTVWVDRMIHLKEVENCTAQLLDKLANGFDKIIRLTDPVEAEADSSYELFEKDVVNHMKSQIEEKINQILSDKIFDPLLDEVPPTLVRYHHERIQDNYRNAKGGDIEQFRAYKSNYEESILHDGDDLPAISASTGEYHANVLLLLSKTRNLQLLSDLIRENVPMDMTCLQAFINMLPHILRRLGVQQRMRIVVEDCGDDNTQAFKSRSNVEEVERVIRLRVKHNKFEAVGLRRRNSLNIVGLYWALSEHFDLGVTEDKFRISTAEMVKEVKEIRSINSKDWHLNGISLKMHGEAHPYDHDDWSFDPQVDIDLCRGAWVDTGYGNKWEERILTREELYGQYTEAYRRTLQRINEILNGQSTNHHWSDCKLIRPHRRIQPHDFEATKYHAIRVTKGLGSNGIALYPVEIKSKIRVKRDKFEDECCYEVVIHTEGVSDGQRGPQGPHIGYSISDCNSQGRKLVSGHCLISSIGNEHLPCRSKDAFDKDITHHSFRRIPVQKLFQNQLETADKQNPPIERFPSSTI